MGYHHCASGEFDQRVFQRFQRLNIQIIRGLIEQQQIAALLQGEGKIQTIALATGEYAGQFLLVGTFETETGDICPCRYLDAADFDEVVAIGDGFPQILIRIEPCSVLIDIGDFYRVSDSQFT